MNNNGLTKSFYAGALIILALYMVGYFWPERFWGVHFFRFLETEQLLAILLTGLSVAVIPFGLFEMVNSHLRKWKSSSFLIFAALTSITFGALVYMNPIAYDPYGDAVRFQNHLDKVASISPQIYNYLFGFSLDAWSGEKSVLALVSVVSYHLNLIHAEAFSLLDTVSAVIFSFTWLTYVFRNTSNRALVLPLGLAGLMGPCTLIFFGHAEIYAPALAAIMVWVTMISEAVRSKTLINQFLLLIVNLLVIKLHPIGIMLMPVSFVVVASSYLGDKMPLLKEKKLIPVILTPILILGLAVYFFILQDHIDDRSLQITAKQYDHLFLPLLSPEPPLHKYNMFSLNHIVDFMNVLLMISPPMLLIFLMGITLRPKNSSQNMSVLNYLTLALALVLLLLFAINPLLSMPMDWDLYMLFVPILLGAAVLVTEGNVAALIVRNASIVLGLSVLSTAFVVSSQNANNISDRLLTIAVHVHNSYYEWTMNIIDRAFSNSTDTETIKNTKRDELREKLRLNAQNHDREFSEFLRQDSKRCYQMEGDYVNAQRYLTEALKYNPSDGNNYTTGVELNFELKRYKEAFRLSQKLIELSHPDKETALRIAIHCALEAGMYDEAQRLCYEYLQSFENEVILTVYTSLVTNDDVDSLKLLFQRQQS